MGGEERDDTWILFSVVVSEGGQKDGIYYERYHAASMACLQRFYLTTLHVTLSSCSAVSAGADASIDRGRYVPSCADKPHVHKD